ncbi:esterase/lipase family protein [Rubritalea tangerina]|uniref:Esterase/lipase family protein n=1 Tax=Rubritalea tangerina TaxID=430798 RepID=A0ABW4ZAQ0_9BACT
MKLSTFRKELGEGEALQLYDVVHQNILSARGYEKRDPERAIAIYLHAAELAWRSREEALIPLYNHAVGQSADLLLSRRVRQGARFTLAHREYTVRYDGAGENIFPVADFDDLIPVDCMQRSGIRSEVSQEGVGAAMVALHGTMGEKENPFVSPVGGDFNLTALLAFTESGEAVFRFYDVTKCHSAKFWGRERDLNINLTAAYYMVAERKSSGAGASKIMGVFRPMRYSGRMGLYLEPRFDPDKIPLILVHGLVSSPMTWADPMNEIMADPRIRANYQGYTYYYPTGFPTRMTGAKLKEDLLRLEAYAKSRGASDRADKMVIFGHSMGGLLTSMNVRVLDESSWSRISNEPIDALPTSDVIKDDYKMIFEVDQPKGLKRAVFIATPHRGSNKANTWYGGFVAKLIEIPTNLVQLNLVAMTQSMTDLGKTLFNSEAPVNSMKTLREGNPVLQFVVDRPMEPYVTYHSIMGDRGKGDTPNSSDGIVPYSSSHIDGAESELIVPSGHSAHRDPAAVKEMQRILLEHLDKNGL